MTVTYEKGDDREMTMIVAYAKGLVLEMVIQEVTIDHVRGLLSLLSLGHPRKRRLS